MATLPRGSLCSQSSQDSAPTDNIPLQSTTPHQFRTQNSHTPPGAFDPLWDAFTPSNDSRPPISQRPRSDTRHDRIRRTRHSFGSPLPKQRRRIQRAARPQPCPPSSESPPSTNPSAPEPNVDRGVAFSQSEPNLARSVNEDGATPPAASTEPSFTRTPREVHDEQQRRLAKQASPDTTKGTVYVIQNLKPPYLIKIGETNRDPLERLKEIQSKCGVKAKLVYRTEKLKMYKRAEFLAHGDLLHLRKLHACDSPACDVKEHREWHVVDKDTAIGVVERWKRFIEQQPYDSAGNLKDFWENLLSKRRRRLMAPTDSSFDHAARWEHWDRVLQPPTLMDYCEYWYLILRNHPVWISLWDFSWQISAILAWTALFSVLRNPFSFSIMFLHMACCWVNLSSRLGQVAPPRKGGIRQRSSSGGKAQEPKR